MSRYFSYLNSAVSLIKSFTGVEPFVFHSKRFFSLHKKYGSSDRKQITSLCYCFFRLGKSLSHFSLEERILAGTFLCSNEPNGVLNTLKPEWNESVACLIEEKCKMIDSSFEIEAIFPWENELSEAVERSAFIKSFLIQPDLFLRLRSGHEKSVPEKLQSNNISFTLIEEDCLALPNGTKIENLLDINKEAVVQDYSSQLVGSFYKLLKDVKKPLSVWDCCAASGGKSIMAVDLLGGIDLTVSDIRKSILINLQKRFAEAGITQYKSFVVDLSQPNQIVKKNYDFVIADVPCTGSGTWSRTPEQLYYFEQTKIEYYADLQKKIVVNALQHLKSNGYFLYITCSVFKKENEDVVSFIEQHQPMKIISQQYFTGYHHKADTLFATLFQKL